MLKPKVVKVNGTNLLNILEKHKIWLEGNTDSQIRMRGERAALSYIQLEKVDLSGVDLSFASLEYVEFYECDLSGACLNGSKLNHVTFDKSNLCGLSLSHASLYYVDIDNSIMMNLDLRNITMHYSRLGCSNIFNADFSDSYADTVHITNCMFNGSHMRGSTFQYCNFNIVHFLEMDLTDARFHDSVLRNVSFDSSDITRVDFRGSSMKYTSLRNTNGELLEFRKGKILREDIIGYKQCSFSNPSGCNYHKAIVTLLIPKGSIVFSINGYKCRTNRAKVIAIHDYNGNPLKRANSGYKYMSYYVGDEFNMYNFNCEYNIECAEGIHFFMDKQQAMDF